MVELKKLRFAPVLPVLLLLVSCPNSFFGNVQAIVGGTAPGQVSAPVLSPGTGIYSTSQSVSISCVNAGATIYYTTDGSTPTLSSPTYSGPFLLASPGATVQAFAAESGMTSSAVAAAVIQVGVSIGVAVPMISPATGRLGHAATVSLACATSGATIVYTTDGTTPTHGSSAYGGPFTLPYGDTTVRALAFKTGMTDSAVASSAFTEPVFVYVASSPASAVYAEKVNLTDGSLSSAGAVPIAGATSVVADPAGRFLFVAAGTPTPAWAYTIDPSTGTLGFASNTTVGSLTASAAVDNTGQFLYVSTSGASGVTLYTINQSTGALFQVVTFTPSGLTGGLAMDPVAPYLYVALTSPGMVQAYSIAGDGSLASVGVYTSMPGNSSLVVDPTGKFLYTTSQTGGQVAGFAINAGTGALTSVGQWSAGNSIALAIEPSGRFLYVADYGGSSIYGFQINASTGLLTQILGPLGDPGGSNPVSLTVEPSGRFLYVAHGTSTGMTTFSINSTTGALAAVGTPSIGGNQSWVTSTGVAQ